MSNLAYSSVSFFQMGEKGAVPICTSQLLRLKSWLYNYKGLPTLTASLFISMVLIWAIGSCTFRAYQRQDNISIPLITTISSLSSKNLSDKPNAATTSTTTSLSSPSAQNLTHNTNVIPLSAPLSATQNTSTTLFSQNPNHPLQSPSSLSSKNLTHPLQSPSSLSSQNLNHIPNSPHQNSTHTSASTSWISIIMERNFTSNLLARWLSPGGQPCLDSRSTDIKIPELDGRDSIELSTGGIHEFVFSAYDDAGNARCSGGDYFETDLSGESWKSRPPVKDLGNGSYTFSLQIHPDFAGEFNLTVVLLFRSFQGLKFSTERLAFRKELRNIPIKFIPGSSPLPELHICGASDFSRDIWSGRWTRHGKNDHCNIDQDGRYRCLDAGFPCKNPWCNGSLGLLESNGWVYSAHCAFKIFTADSAWQCLQNRWIFFWGDSNHVDSIRNLLNFVLGLPEIHSVPRRFDTNFTNPKNPSQSVRITSIFNGHWNETKNYEGLNSLRNDGFRDLLKQYFSESTVPDTMILNSGLHDGIHWRSIRAFSEGAEYAAKFWEETLAPIRQKGRMPRLFYRTTIATGGYARALAFNPSKMEAFNLVLLEKLRDRGLVTGVIDNFDMTFPWHYDNRCNDGVHYGRAPAKARWRDGEIGHQYFVDLMLGHVLLNAICAEE